MNAEIWTIIAVGVALAGLQWRMYAALNGRMDRIEARMDRFETRLDQMQQDMASVKERLARLEGQVEMLLRGLHIEISGDGSD